MRVHRRGVLTLAIAMALFGVGAVLIYEGRSVPAPHALAEPALEASGVDAARAQQWQPPQPKVKPRIVSDTERDDLLRRAHVWRQPAVPIDQFDFRDPPPVPSLDCRFIVTAVGGTTPKFDCDLPSGEPVRIKYGATGELQAEYSATRLLRAFGF